MFSVCLKADYPRKHKSFIVLKEAAFIFQTLVSKAGWWLIKSWRFGEDNRCAKHFPACLLSHISEGGSEKPVQINTGLFNPTCSRSLVEPQKTFAEVLPSVTQTTTLMEKLLKSNWNHKNMFNKRNKSKNVPSFLLFCLIYSLFWLCFHIPKTDKPLKLRRQNPLRRYWRQTSACGGLISEESSGRKKLGALYRIPVQLFMCFFSPTSDWQRRGEARSRRLTKRKPR